MQRIVTAITAMALALSIFGFTAQPAAAVSGYDSAYFGESAFLTLAPGTTGQFVAIFTNTGATGWVTGTGTQVNLAVCLADKTTCNVASPNAAWASAWLSSTAYATTSTSYVGPGQQGFFIYSVTAPAAGGYARFNGDLSLAATGQMIHPQGYYQDAFSPAPAVLTTTAPTTASTAGGTTLVINGTGFICPGLTVTVGGAAATVTLCTPTAVTVTTPAGTAGSQPVVVTNAGAPASNTLSITLAVPAAVLTTLTPNTSPPIGGGSLVIAGTGFTCAPDPIVTIGGVTATVTLCTPLALTVTVPALTAGSHPVTVTNAGGTASNALTLTVALVTTPPTLASATGTGSTVTLTFSQPVYCTGTFPATTATLTGGTGTPPTIATITCPQTAGAASTTFTATTSAPLTVGTAYTVHLTTTTATGQVLNSSGVAMASPATATFTP